MACGLQVTTQAMRGQPNASTTAIATCKYIIQTYGVKSLFRGYAVLLLNTHAFINYTCAVIYDE